MKTNFLNSIFFKIISFGFYSKIPQKQILYGFFFYVLLGTFFLSLPFAQKEYIHLIDNLFNATSAISTTGLATISISDNYTFFGQIIILLLIQIGGIGYMSFSSFVILKMTNELSSSKTNVLSTEFSIPSNFNIIELVKSIITFTLVFELIGSIILFFVFINEGISEPVWNAIFHSISAFCTAGFSLFNDSFEQLKLNSVLNITVSVLSYLGGIGFIVLLDFWKRIKSKEHTITFTSKIILFVTLFFTVFGTIQLALFEPSIQQYNDYEKLTLAFFQTMTSLTTVGFNTISITNLHPSSLMLIVILMYVGASPSGTGGGLKSTTLSAIFAFLFSKLTLKQDVTLLGKKIPDYRVNSALSIFIFYTSILFIGSYILTFTENANLLQILFECGSALGTVGLSTGITGTLTNFGKIIITLLMFVGRVGVITIGNALLIRTIRKIQESDLAI